MTRLVVLRPELGATATAARATAAGFDAVVAPLFTVRPIEWEPPEGPFDAVMVTSANAARHAGPALARYTGLPVHAVGAETAAAARAAGFADVRAGAGGLEELLAAVGEGVRVLHLAGREHRAPLPPGGVRRVVYASESVVGLPRDAERALAAGAVALLHSPRAAAVLTTLTEAAGLARGELRLATLSPAVADAAGAGWRSVAVAARPTDAALLAAIGAPGD